MKTKINIQSLNGIFLDADKEQLITIELPQNNDYGELALIGDLHLGHESVSKTVLKAYLDYIKQHKNIQIGLMGDLIEYNEVSNFISEEEQPKIDRQLEMFKGLFLPLADRIRFILWGNHEERFAKTSKSKRLLRDMIYELNINPDNIAIGQPQRGLFIAVKSGDKYYGLYTHHSKTNARVNQEIQLQRSGSQNILSVLAFGHIHRLGWKPRTFRTLELINGQVYNVIRRQYLVNTGCFLRYPGYAEATSMPYTDVGCPFIKFYSNQHKIEIYDLTGVYKTYLDSSGITIPTLKLNKTYEIRNQYNIPKIDSEVKRLIKERKI